MNDRRTIVDGWGFLTAQRSELRDFCRSLGIDLDEMYPKGIWIRMTEELVLVSNRPDGLNPIALTIATGYGAYRSEEFREFCKRLGIAWELLTKEITLSFFEAQTPTVTQVYLMSEAKEEADSPLTVKTRTS